MSDEQHQHQHQTARVLALGSIDLCIRLSTPEVGMLEAQLQPGFDSGQHHHSREHETLYVLSGSIVVDMAGNTYTLTAGELVHLAPSQRHRFANPGPDPATLLIVVVPGQLVAYFVELEGLVAQQASRELVAGLNNRYGLVF
jgi:quercetin dioxygenase-like cupin family protein